MRGRHHLLPSLLFSSLRRLVVLAVLATMTWIQPATYAGDSLAYEWRNVTVGAGGFAPNIIFSTAEPGLAYLRTDMGGAYRWDASIETWVPLQDSMPEGSYMGIESLAADPVDPNVVYLAAGMYQGNPSAILRSEDQGETWHITPVPFSMGGNEDGRGLGERLAIDPDNRSQLFFGSRHDGLQASEDSGKTWRKLAAFPYPGQGQPSDSRHTNAGISFVVFGPRGESLPNRPIFVGVADPGTPHLYRSDNGGQTWHPVSGGPPATFLPAQAAADDHGQLYITYTNGPGPNGITDGGVWRLDTTTSRWTDITPGKEDIRTAGGYMALSLDRQVPGRLAVATMNRWKPGDTIWLSTDSGASWTDIGKDASRDVGITPYLEWGNKTADFGWWIAGLAIDPFDSAHMAYTTGATLYSTRSLSVKGSAETWRPWVRGIEQTAIITLRSPPKGPALLSGFGDISGFAHQALDVSPDHQFTSPLFANTNVIDYAGIAPNIVVRSGTPGHRLPKGSPTLAYSTDYGLTWTALRAPAFVGLNENGERERRRYDLTGDVAIATNADGNSIIVMTPIPVLTKDRGKSWRPLDLPLWARPVADRVDPNRLYVVHFGAATILASNDGGNSFKNVDSTGLPSHITADMPTWQEKPWPLLATPGMSGDLWYLSPTTGQLYHSPDGGHTFTPVDSDIHIEALAFGKAAPGRDYPMLYSIASHHGLKAIWRSIDRGKSWVRINDSKHEYGRRFRTIEGDPRIYGRVYVGTDGRGILYGDPLSGN